MPSSDAVPTDVIDQLLEVNRGISHSLSGARSYLLSEFKLLSDPQGNAISGGWSQFLNEQYEPPSVTGTAHGIVSLKACGENMHSEVVQLGRRFISENARTDGGWTKPSLRSHCSLTRISSLALIALIDAGESLTSESIRNGMRWLLNAQNDDGGWGNMARDRKSDVTSTSLAVKALAYVPGISRKAREALVRGRDWLLGARNQDHSWGQAAKKSGTIAYTSEAVEALLSSGVDRSELEPVRDWLIDHINEDAQIIERYLIEVPQSENTLTMTWTQVSRERALIALVKLGSNVAQPGVFNSVRRVLDRQVNHTYWLSETYPDSQPIWGMKEAVVSLHLYQDILRSDLAAIALSEEIANLRDDVRKLGARISGLESHMAVISLKSRIARVARFLKRPAPLVTVVTTVLIALYLYLKSLFTFPEYTDVFMGILAILGFGFSIYQTLRRERQ